MRPHVGALRLAALAMDGSEARDHDLQAAALRFAVVAVMRTGLSLLEPADRAALVADPGEDTGIVLSLLAVLMAGARS